MQNLNIPDFVDYYARRDVDGDGANTAADLALAADLARRVCEDFVDRYELKNTGCLTQMPSCIDGDPGLQFLQCLSFHRLESFIQYVLFFERIEERVVTDVLLNRLSLSKPGSLQREISELTDLFSWYVDELCKQDAVDDGVALAQDLHALCLKAEDEGFKTLSAYERFQILNMGHVVATLHYKQCRYDERKYLQAIRSLQAAVLPFEYYSKESFLSVMSQVESSIQNRHPKVVAFGEHHDQSESWLALLKLADAHAEDLGGVALEIDHTMQPILDDMFLRIQREPILSEETKRSLDTSFEKIRYHGIAGYAPTEEPLSARIVAMRSTLVELMRRGIRLHAIDNLSAVDTSQTRAMRNQVMALALKRLAAGLKDNQFIAFVAGALHIAPHTESVSDLLNQSDLSTLSVNLAYLDALPQKERFSHFDIDVRRMEQDSL